MAGVKNFIAPFQQVLINKKLCPACTLPLDRGQKFEFNANSDMVICSCRRMFIYDRSTNTYRRATLREAEVFSKKA